MSFYREQPNYTTRPSLPKRLGRFLLILLILGGIASAIFLFFFRGYVSDTEDGPRLRIPFLAKKTEIQPVFSDDTNLTISDVQDDILIEPLHAIHLASDSILDGSFEGLAQSKNCNAVIFDMRFEDGSLGYVSGLSLAIESGASAAQPGLNEAIRAMNQNTELYTIARISCFPDNKLTGLDKNLGLVRQSGSLWLDDAKTAWLSPAQDQVQSYLADICREVSDLGFDEILLVNCTYPVGETLSQLTDSGDYSPDELSITIENFYRELRKVLEGTGLRLSIFFETDHLGEGGVTNGQSLEAAALYADRIWMEKDQEESAAVFAQYGLSASGTSLVSILPNSGHKSLSWAIF